MGMKNSIVNWFDSCYVDKVPKFSKHSIGWNDFYERGKLRYSSKYIPKYPT